MFNNVLNCYLVLVNDDCAFISLALWARSSIMFISFFVQLDCDELNGRAKNGVMRKMSGAERKRQTHPYIGIVQKLRRNDIILLFASGDARQMRLPRCYWRASRFSSMCHIVRSYRGHPRYSETGVCNKGTRGGRDLFLLGWRLAGKVTPLARITSCLIMVDFISQSNCGDLSCTFPESTPINLKRPQHAC